LKLSCHEIDEITDICWKYGIPSKLTGGGAGGIVTAFLIGNNITEKNSELLIEVGKFFLIIFYSVLGVEDKI